MNRSYYTENGTLIKNNYAYAKTGAPMYETKYDNSKNINEEEKLGTDITDLIKEIPKEIKKDEVLENIKYVDQEGYEFEYVNEGDYDDNDSVYSDEDGNLIRYIDKGYKNKPKKKSKKKKVNKINYKYFIIYSLIILLIIILIKNYRISLLK